MLALLQFDSAAVPLVERMLGEGRLPALAALRRRGQWQMLDAGATFLQSSTYMTLCTGVDVRDHGVYSAVPWVAAEQRPRFMYAVGDRPATIWERLTTAGRRSLIIDPTLAWAPGSMCGAFLSGWQFEDRMSARRVSVPRPIGRALRRRHGAGPRLDDVYGTRRVETLLAWRTGLVNASTRAADAAIDLLRHEPFDLLWLNFAASHKAGHHLWDPASVVADPLGGDDAATLRTGLEDVYAAIDRAIGRVVAALPDRADIIVFSPTGMAANTSRADLLPGMLNAVLGGARRKASRSPIWALRSSIPGAWRDRIARGLPDAWVADVATRLYMRHDWSHTRAMVVPGENKGYIRFNVRGRERDGIVTSGETGGLAETIAHGLLGFRDPDGSPSISKVERMTEMTRDGSHLHWLPDLVVHWGDRPAGGLTRVVSPTHGEVARTGVGSGRSGNHVDAAWAVLAPGLSRVRTLARPARITDIGATACAMLGADVAGLSGTSLFETQA